MLLVEECDHYTEFSEEERKEFLFLLFRHLQLGGRINQVSVIFCISPVFLVYIVDLFRLIPDLYTHT